MSIGEDCAGGTQSTGRIEHDADGVFSPDFSNGQARIVGLDGPRPHKNSVYKCTQPVQPSNILRARDVMRFARGRRDPSIETLPDLSNDEIGLQLKREKEINQATCRVGWCTGYIPVTGRTYLQPGVRTRIMMHPVRGETL